MSRRYQPDGTLLFTTLAGRVDVVEKTVEDTRQDVAAIGRGLADVTAQMRRLTNLGQPSTPAQGGPDDEPAEVQPDWLAVDDAELALEWLTLAQRFADDVLIHHGVTIAMPCWPLHPTVVTDLLALAGERTAAYTGPAPTPISEWLTRWLPAGVDRITRAMAECQAERGHRADGRTYDVSDFDPLSAASWWARDRHIPAPDAFRFTAF